MSPHPHVIVATQTVTLLLGGLITYFSYSAYRRTELPALRALAIGFAIVTLGSIAGGVMNIIFGQRLLDSLVVESVLTAIGFATITYSLYMK
jgi:4-hydroxybenzoate polyprenyltransferase